MAVWQFVVGLIPRMWIEQDGNAPEMLYDGEGYLDMSIAWKNNQPKANFAELISNVFPPALSWSDSLRIWGDLSTNDIQVGYEGDRVESVKARIDTRKETSNICTKIIELARALDCCLFLPSLHAVTAADVEALSLALQNSQAARYSAAPYEFIERLSHNSDNVG